LSHVEFTSNRAQSYATLHSPFECVYGVNPVTPIVLVPTPSESRVSHDVEVKAKEMKRLHE